MNLRDLREQRAVTVASMRAIADAPGGTNGDLTSEQRSQFDALKAKFKATEDAIERQQILDDAERRMSGQRISGTGDGNLDRELESFSLLRAIASQIPDMRGKVDCGRELELSQEIARRSDLTFQGMAIPHAIFRQKIEKRVVTTTGAPAGSSLIEVDLRSDQYIDLLRAALVIRQLGATVLTNLVGGVDIPRLKTSATSGWVAENSALTPSDEAFEKVSLTPKHVGALTEFSRNMILQASPDVEQIARSDFAQVLASAVDAAAIVASTANGPTGILGVSGIGDVAGGTNGAAPSWANIIDLISKIDDANAMTGRLGFLSNSKVRKKLRTVQRVTSTDSVMIMEDPNSLAGYPFVATSNVPSNLVKGSSGTVCSAIIFGNFADLLLGYWSEFDLLVNPYESVAYSKGNIQIRGFITCDVQVRHAQSFAAMKDALTT